MTRGPSVRGVRRAGVSPSLTAARSYDVQQGDPRDKSASAPHRYERHRGGRGRRRSRAVAAAAWARLEGEEVGVRWLRQRITCHTVTQRLALHALLDHCPRHSDVRLNVRHTAQAVARKLAHGRDSHAAAEPRHIETACLTLRACAHGAPVPACQTRSRDMQERVHIA